VILGIETGGTTVVCAAAETPDEPLELVAIPTTSPAETLPQITDVVRRHAPDLDAVGVGAFGPIDLDPASATFGTLRATPKRGWPGADVLAAVRAGTDAPVVLETDVTAAAVGEQRWGAGAGLDDLAYVTVGTGIGLGAIVEGRRLHGSAHPEAGHLTVRRHPDDPFAGVCRLHGDCLEGLASGPALEQRWGPPAHRSGTALGRLVDQEAFYLAQLAAAISYLLAPRRIVLGGGVLHTPGLLAAVRARTAALLSGALEQHPAGDPTSTYLVRPALGSRAGVIGALTMAADAARGGP
jgi:fructokinase